jgi:hypothetical protein
MVLGVPSPAHKDFGVPPTAQKAFFPSHWELTEGLDYTVNYGGATLGQGNFGCVYSGVLLSTMERIAVKVLKCEANSADAALFGVTAELRTSMLLTGTLLLQPPPPSTLTCPACPC